MTSTYQDFAGLIDTARNREAGKPLANNTRLHDRGDGVLAVRLHDTDVVTLHPDGRVTLDSGGWRTLTTKDRMNSYSPVTVWQKDKEWYVTLPFEWESSPPLPEGWADLPPDERERVWQELHGDDEARHARNIAAREAHTVPYFDGITFDAEGNVLNGPTPAQWKAYYTLRDKRRKLLTKFIGKVRRELAKGIPMPSSGDCWYCALGMDPDAAPKRNQKVNRDRDDHDHLVSHMEEGYVVPTLLVNALREAGYRDAGIYIFLAMNPDEGTMGGPDYRRDLSTVSRAVRRYMERRVLPDPPRA